MKETSAVSFWHTKHSAEQGWRLGELQVSGSTGIISFPYFIGAVAVHLIPCYCARVCVGVLLALGARYAQGKARPRLKTIGTKAGFTRYARDMAGVLTQQPTNC